jgi:hypothetical protein
MLNSFIFKVIILIFSLFSFYYLNIEVASFNNLILILLLITYIYKIYNKAKYNVKLWVYFTTLLILSLGVLLTSWAIILILLKILNIVIPFSIVLLAVDPSQFLDNYLVLSEPFGSDNPDNSGSPITPNGENTGGSEPNGNGGGGPVGNSLGVYVNGDNNDHGESNRGNLHGSTESPREHISRVYDYTNPQSHTTDPVDGMCTHQGKMEEILDGYQDRRTCHRVDGLGERIAADNPVENTPERQRAVEADEAMRQFIMRES